MATKKKSPEGRKDDEWVPALRAICIIGIVILAVVDVSTPDNTIPPYIYASVIGLGTGVRPATISKALSAAAKVFSD